MKTPIHFRIEANGGEDDLFTRTGLPVSQGFDRIVIGERGPYVEFSNTDLYLDNLHIPQHEKYRLNSEVVYYIEYRTTDEANVKVYCQKKTVAYADYRVGFWYISPSDLFLSDGTSVVIEQPSLFDKV